MPYIVRVDRQGRTVLPIEIRRSLGVVRGGSIVVEKRNNRVFIEAGGEPGESVKQWKERIRGLSVEAKAFEPGEAKWLSEDWARKKLGIPA